MKFEDNPLLWLFIITMAITWTIFPFIVMHRLKKIQKHLERSEDCAAIPQEAQEEPSAQPEYQDAPEAST